MYSTTLLYISLGLAAASTSPYAPTTTTCPSGSLIRQGNTHLGDREEAYRVGRKAKADEALASWLDRQSHGLGGAGQGVGLPTLGLAISGGGWRSFLTGAGVMQAMDGREDGDVVTSGLLQALTYHVGVSGGGWLVSSWAGNNFPTVSQLAEQQWKPAFEHGIEAPGGWKGVLAAYADIAADVLAKKKAGYPVSLDDPWSRLLSYQMLGGERGGAATRLSDVARSPSFAGHDVPFPVIGANGVNAVDAGLCGPTDNGTVWEFTPYDFGSWDDGVAAWIPVEHLGTAVGDDECTVGFDNLGFVLGTGSNLFGNSACVEASGGPPPSPFGGELQNVLEKLIDVVHGADEKLDFGRVPNPFRGFNGTGTGQGGEIKAKEVFTDDELYLVDGGVGLHNDPVAPLLEPARNVSVILLSDSSSDEDNFPTGARLIDASRYTSNIPRIASRMPTIPTTKDVFLEKGLNRRAVLFGCDEPDAVTIIYLPNVNYTFQSNLPTTKFQYDADVTEGMISNGALTATQNGAEGWGLCLACAIMMKEEGADLPDGCGACFEQWCYRAPKNVTMPLSRRI
jgi:lysophospholipase